jgi:dihydroflavonol-4-reductase
MAGAYKRSKFLAEKAALDFAAKGLPVVVVNPTAPVGDHDFKPTPTGKMIIDYLRGSMRAYLDTGLNLVDVRDTATGHLLACDRGISGQRYILGSQNVTLREVFLLLEAASGVKAPLRRIPYGLAYVAGVISTGWAAVTGKQPLAPLDGVRMARKKMWVSQALATEKLGYSPSPPGQALHRAVEWFRSNGYC